MIAHAVTGADIDAQVMASPRLKWRVPSWREFAATIVLPAGPLAGTRYRLGSDPCQDYLLAQMDAGIWDRFYVLAPAQVGGKSLLCIQLPILRTTIAQRLPAGYALPTLADLDKAWAAKLHPQIKRSGYQRYLPQSGPGSRGGRGHTLTLTDPETGEACGQVIFLAGGAYGDTCATVVVDEVDQFRTADGTPLWADLEDCFQRATSYGRRAFRVATGTIEDDTESIIVILVDDHGTGTRPWQGCPKCGTFRIWTWAMVHADYRDDDSAADTARIVCPTCSHEIDEPERQKVIRRAVFAHRGQTVDDSGTVLGDAPRTRNLGLAWTGLDSALDDMAAQAVAWGQAQRLIQSHGDHSLARKQVRYKQCTTYHADKDELNEATPLTPQALLLRSQSCKWGPVLHTTDRGANPEGGHTYSRHHADAPGDVVGTVAGIDMQANRAYLILAGLALDGTQYDMGWSYEMARADHQPWGKADLHALLDRCDAVVRRWSGNLPFELGGVDTGDFTADIQGWLKGRKDWVAIKGTTRSLTVEGPNDIEGLVAVHDGLWHVHSDQSRALVQSALRRPNDAPGALVIPHGLANTSTDKAHLQHYCGEQIQPDPKSGKSKKIQRGRWDWLDARRYAYVLGRVVIARRNRPPPPIRQYGVISNATPDFR